MTIDLTLSVRLQRAIGPDCWMWSDPALELLAECQSVIRNLEIQYEATRDALEEMGRRYGATVEWDSEGLPALTMPLSKDLLDRVRQQHREALDQLADQ